MKISKMNAAIAGLLHDIGKLEQRTSVNSQNPVLGIKTSVHTSWTTHFAQNNLPERFQKAVIQAAYHHNPDESPYKDKSLSVLISLADLLSTGEQSDLPKDFPNKQPPQQMISIFDRVSVNNSPRHKDFHYLPLKSLCLDSDTIFAKHLHSKVNQNNSYKALYNELESAARQDSSDDETYLENLLAAMQRTTWCVPSAYYHSIPDISLYYHSRMTAALAVCLSEIPEDEVRVLLEAVTRKFESVAKDNDNALIEQPLVLLVGGDISGVQDFIYTISSKQAAKTLRGRSFYLQLLTEAVLRFILQELDLPFTNVIYSGGGHFFLLAPINSRTDIKRIQSKITKILLEHHGIGLYLTLGQAKVSALDFQLGNFSASWKQMHKNINLAKRQKYTELGNDFHNEVFELKEHGGNQEDTCSVCGKESLNISIIKDGGENDRICALCRSFAETMGTSLPKSQFVGLGFTTPKNTERNSAFNVLRAFGMLVEWPDEQNNIQFSEPVERAVVWALGDTTTWPVVKKNTFSQSDTLHAQSGTLDS